MARQDSVSAVASLDPNEMLQGGLKDDFDGTIVEAVYARWDYDGNIDAPVLAARITIQPDEEEEPFSQHYSAGSLDSFVPSRDGKEPCDDDEAGPFALRVGKRAQLNNNTNFAHLMSSIIDSGEASGKFKRTNLTPSLECLKGLSAHWNRVPQKKRSGLVQATEEGGQRRRVPEVLVVTEVKGYGKVAAVKGGPAKAAVKEEVSDDLDEKVQGVIVEAISESNGTLKKVKVAQEVLKRLAKDSQKGKAVKRCLELDFLQGGPWEFDANKGTLTLGE